MAIRVLELSGLVRVVARLEILRIDASLNAHGQQFLQQ